MSRAAAFRNLREQTREIAKQKRVEIHIVPPHKPKQTKKKVKSKKVIKTVKQTTIRYKRTPCGFMEPILPKIGATMPARLKHKNEFPLRLLKMGVTFGDIDSDGWTHYTTPEGSVGKFRLAPDKQDDDNETEKG